MGGPWCWLLAGHQETLASERARIVRELHDIVAHSVSLMGAQAVAARLFLDTDPDRVGYAPRLVMEWTADL